MNRIYYVLGVVALWACLAWSASSETRTHVTPAEQCPGQNFEDLRERVQIEPSCGKSRCKLRKGTNATIHIRFKLAHEVKTLTTQVTATIAEVQVPYIGVTGTSACADITKADSGDPAPCPLEPEVDYHYTKTFPIEMFYPSLSFRVHWALNDGKHDIICFEVPATIK